MTTACPIARRDAWWAAGDPRFDEPHPQSPRRPASDREIIATILDRIAAAMEATP